MIVNEYDLGLVSRDVHHLDRSWLVRNGNGEGIIDENTDNDSIFHAHKERLFLGRARHHLDVCDLVLENPFSHKNASECQQLDLLFKDKHKILGRDEQVGAVDALVDLLVRLVLHVIRVVGLNRVDDDLLGKLNRQTILVDRNLLDVVTAPDLDTSLRHQVLNDNISHQLAISIPFLIQSVHLVKVDLP